MAPCPFFSARRAWILGGILALGSAGCGDSPTAESDLEPVEARSIRLAPPSGAISRELLVELSRPSRIVVEYGSEGLERLRVESPDALTVHRIFLPRLRPDRAYDYAVRTSPSPAGSPPLGDGRFQTDPLPDPLAELEFEVEGTAGFPLVFLEVGRPTGPYFPIIVDTGGEVVWYSLHPDRMASGFTLFEDTLFAFNTARGIQIVSPRSQELVAELSRTRGAQRTGIDPFHIHHDVTATPAGTLLFLVLDPTVAGDTVWMGEAIWEWDPHTDALHRRWRSGDVLDPATDRGARSTPDDWLHANGLSIGPRGNVLISFFWLHEVLSIAPGWASVEWRLGGPASSFSGVEPIMEAGQHTPTEVSADHVLMFDNGLDREAGEFSRAVELRLDRSTWRAEVAWEFRPSPDIFAPIVSSVHRLPGGSTFVNFGLVEGFFGGASTGPLAFFEVNPAGEVLWRMELRAGVELVYRATPLESIAGEATVGPEAGAGRGGR